MLEAAGSIVVLFYLCWRLAPVLASVIVGTAVAAAVYRKVAKGIEGKLARALSTMSKVAGQAFTNIRTVRAFAGAASPRCRVGRWHSNWYRWRRWHEPSAPSGDAECSPGEPLSLIHI